MKKLHLSVFMLFFTGILFFSFPLYSQDDIKPWERLGLSITEWKLIQDNRMPMSKVEELLKDGIGISEYFEKPWEKLGMTEDKWIAKRKSGLTNDDIEQEQLAAESRSLQNAHPEESNFKEFDVSQENAQLFKSFIAPGYLQYRDTRKTKGKIMIGLAAGSVVGCAAISIVRKQFIPLPLLVLLIPDMCWSLHNQKKYMAAAQP